MKTHLFFIKYLIFISFVALSGCNDSDGKPVGVAPTVSQDDIDVLDLSSVDVDVFFEKRIAPRLDFCRTCHVPGGVGDTADGKDFMLSKSPSEDEDNMRKAWEVLGKGVEENKILTMNSLTSEGHGGGQNWPQGSTAYADVMRLLSCWQEPESCEEESVTDEP